MTKAREQLTTRLRHTIHARCLPTRWNTTQYRRAFAYWAALYEGILPDHHLIVPYAASAISSLTYSTHALQPRELGALISWGFVLLLQLAPSSSSLYWHSLLCHLAPVYQYTGCSPFALLEELQEGYFRPVKQWLRTRSNHKTSKDLLLVRAMDEVMRVAKTHYDNKEFHSSDWPSFVGLGILFAPCTIDSDIFLANAQGFLSTLERLGCGHAVRSVNIQGRSLLAVDIGDTATRTTVCVCGVHTVLTGGEGSHGWTILPSAAAAAKSRLELAQVTVPDAVEPDSDDYLSSASSRSSASSTNTESATSSDDEDNLGRVTRSQTVAKRRRVEAQHRAQRRRAAALSSVEYLEPDLFA